MPSHRPKPILKKISGKSSNKPVRDNSRDAREARETKEYKGGKGGKQAAGPSVTDRNTKANADSKYRQTFQVKKVKEVPKAEQLVADESGEEDGFGEEEEGDEEMASGSEVDTDEEIARGPEGTKKKSTSE